jgi:hypothetical protein
MKVKIYRKLVLFIFVLIIVHTGCAPVPLTLREEEKIQLGTVGVVAARFPPESSLIELGVKTMDPHLLMHPVGLLLLPFVAAGSGIYDAATEMSEDRAEEIETSIEKIHDELRIQEFMAEQVFRAGQKLTEFHFLLNKEIGPASPTEQPDYRSLRIKSIDSILEISVLENGLESEKNTKEDFAFFVEVRARIIRSTDGDELISQKYSYKSQKHKSAEWFADGAKLLQEEFYRSYQLLSERIVELVFLLADFPSRTKDSRGWVKCWLSPIYPETQISFWRAHAGWEFVEVDSLKPTFQWETFPREKDKKKDKEGRLKRISNVTYDLKIWRMEDKIPVELIYFRQGLVSSSHKLEQPLDPGNKYCWTVRARFNEHGQFRVTGWASHQCEYWSFIPVHDKYYLFKTPPEGEIPKY